MNLIVLCASHLLLRASIVPRTATSNCRSFKCRNELIRGWHWFFRNEKKEWHNLNVNHCGMRMSVIEGGTSCVVSKVSLNFSHARIRQQVVKFEFSTVIDVNIGLGNLLFAIYHMSRYNKLGMITISPVFSRSLSVDARTL